VLLRKSWFRGKEPGEALRRPQGIDDLSFGVARGERLALIGPNGAGKTTVFNLMTGVYRSMPAACSSRATTSTALASRYRIRAARAHVPEHPADGHLSVLENVMIAQYARSPGWRRCCSRSASGAATAGARKRARPSPQRASRATPTSRGGLPYGIQKRVELVRALLAAPRVLLLDEPAAGLNPPRPKRCTRRSRPSPRAA